MRHGEESGVRLLKHTGQVLFLVLGVALKRALPWIRKKAYEAVQEERTAAGFSRELLPG
jgi:hypothetical protein